MYKLPFRGKVRVTCPFGKAGNWQAGFHVGLDLVGDENKRIHPIGNGVVESINAHGNAYGKHVCVRHEDGNVSLYAHLANIYVDKGQKVGISSALGMEGATGNASGSHLHLEIHRGYYKYPPKGSSPASCPWLLNPAEALGIENQVGEAVSLTEKASEWAKEAQNWVIENNISDGLRPKEEVTREETWVMLWRLAHALR
jgi:murein DD-endopeptidase MepM/ murein hydrolase activator NlpD